MNILLIVYKIEANKGSEDGTGFHLVQALLKKQQNITLITRTNNVEKLKSEHGFANVEVIGVDVPSWLGFFKNKGRGITLYYYLWQIAVGLKVRALQKQRSFDVIHQLNFHATWAPHFLFSDKAKLVWGPLTHHAPVPKDLWFGSSVSYFFHEKIKNWIKRIFWHVDPFLFWAAKRTKAILYSAQTVVWPYSAHKDKLRLMTYAGSAFPTFNDRPVKGRFNILFVGRFVNLKGCMLAIDAIKEFIGPLSNEDRRSVSVTIIGDGDLYADMVAAAQILMSATSVSVEVLPWQEQENLIDHYQMASVFIFPSFEGQGLVVAEALTQGCPVLCFEHTGPHDIAGVAAITVSSKGSAVEVVNRLSARLQSLYSEYKNHPMEYAKRTDVALVRAKDLSWSQTADRILEAYHA